MKNLTGKQPRLMNIDRPILLHDNARPPTAKQTQLKIVELAFLYNPFLPISQSIFKIFGNSIV